MEIWLKGSKKFRFPVLPAEYNVSSSRGNEIVNVNAIGDVDLGGKNGLRTISFSSFFPKHYDSSYCDYRSKSPKRCVETVEKIKNGSVCKVLITGTPINFSCRVETFEWSEKDGSGDIYFSITLKEHRPVSIGTSKVTMIPETAGTTVVDSGVERVQPETPAAATYTVVKGDCLSTIARKTGGGTSWQQIYEQNKAVIGSNPNLIQPGMVLTIPGNSS